MTELDQVVAMFDRAGVKYVRGGNAEGYVWLSAESDGGPVNTGYGGFVAQLEFYPDGRLRSIGAWE